MRLRVLELNGGRVRKKPYWQLVLPPTSAGYADAQIDDYGLANQSRNKYPWLPGTLLQLRARFSDPAEQLTGTAGFGFWNAPFADPNVRWPALPQAAWFFFASEPTDLPLAPAGPGRGWFAATIDAGTPAALSLIPLAPLVLILHQFSRLRQRIWPAVQRRLQISYAQISGSMDVWHHYSLDWKPDGCCFLIDGQQVLATSFSPRGPLGFVCWIDNQYLIATNRGRFAWGKLPTQSKQLLEITDLHITRR